MQLVRQEALLMAVMQNNSLDVELARHTKRSARRRYYVNRATKQLQQLVDDNQLQQAVEEHNAEAVTEASKQYLEKKARPSLMAVWFNAWWVPDAIYSTAPVHETCCKLHCIICHLQQR
jgi:hypothetical protein